MYNTRKMEILDTNKLSEAIRAQRVLNKMFDSGETFRTSDLEYKGIAQPATLLKYGIIEKVKTVNYSDIDLCSDSVHAFNLDTQKAEPMCRIACGGHYEIRDGLYVSHRYNIYKVKFDTIEELKDALIENIKNM